jgi:hypothetical protein
MCRRMTLVRTDVSEVIRFSDTSVLSGATWRHIPEELYPCIKSISGLQNQSPTRWLSTSKWGHNLTILPHSLPVVQLLLQISDGVECKDSPGSNYLSITPWRRMGEWIYVILSKLSWPWRWLETNYTQVLFTLTFKQLSFWYIFMCELIFRYSKRCM